MKEVTFYFFFWLLEGHNYLRELESKLTVAVS